jgi:hypothetical protein
MQISRRDLLAKTSLLASAMTVLPGTTVAGAQPSSTPNPKDRLEYARIRARLDGRPAYGVARGIKYALSDFEKIPIHGYNVLAATISTVQPDGSLLFRILEAPYATDLATGEAINVFTNPLTDVEESIPHIKPLMLFYAVDRAGALTIAAGDPRVGKVEFSGSVQARRGISSDVLIEERFVMRSPPRAGSSEKGVLSELVNHTAVASSLSEDGVLYEEARANIVVVRNGIEGPVTAGYPPMLLACFEARKFLAFGDAVQEAGETQMEQAHPGFLERLTKFA